MLHNATNKSKENQFGKDKRSYIYVLHSNITVIHETVDATRLKRVARYIGKLWAKTNRRCRKLGAEDEADAAYRQFLAAADRFSKVKLSRRRNTTPSTNLCLFEQPPPEILVAFVL